MAVVSVAANSRANCSPGIVVEPWPRWASAREGQLRLPAAVGRAVLGREIRSAVNIVDTGLLLVHRDQRIFHIERPVRVAREGIPGNIANVSRLFQVIQSLRSLLFIERVLLDRVAQSEQVLAQSRLLGPQNRAVVHGDRDRDEDQDQTDHDHHFDQGEAATFLAQSPHLPVLVLRPVECCFFRLGVDVEYALCAPGVRSGIVLHRAHAPFRFIGEGIDLNLAQELQLLTVCIDTLNQSVQIGWIAFAAKFDLKGATVGRIFVAVNRVPHLPEVVAQHALLFALDADPGQWYRHPGQNHHDRGGDNQLHQRETAGLTSLRRRPICPSYYRHPQVPLRYLPLLYVHDGLSAIDRDRLHGGIARSAAGNRERRLPAGFSHERERDHRSLPGNASRIRWPGRGDLQCSCCFILAVYEGYGLSVLAQESSVRHVDQLELRRVVVQLEWDGVHILCSGNQHIYSERSAFGLRGCAGIKQEARASRSWRGCRLRHRPGGLRSRSLRWSLRWNDRRRLDLLVRDAA